MTDQQYKTMLDAQAVAKLQGWHRLADEIRRKIEEADSERKELAAPF